jgi:NitT/TauT family transport system substrate-binding protein
VIRRKEALLGLAAAALAIRAPGAAQDLPELRLATLPSDAGSQPYYGLDMGFFAKAGVAVRLDTQQSGPAIAAAVASGALDIGFSNTISIAAAHKRGLPFTFVAPGSIYVSAAPTSALLVRKDSSLRTARDLNGKTIGANALKNIAQFAPLAWVDQNGGDASTLRFVELPADAMAAALESNRIDAGMMPEPQISQARATCRVFAKAYDAIGEGFMIAGWFATTAWADAHPDLVRRFSVAMREASLWANRNPALSLPILEKYTKLDPLVARQVIRARFAEVLTPQIVQPSIDIVAHYKVIDAAYPAQELIYAGNRR